MYSSAPLLMPHWDRQRETVMEQHCCARVPRGAHKKGGSSKMAASFARGAHCFVRVMSFVGLCCC